MSLQTTFFTLSRGSIIPTLTRILRNPHQISVSWQGRQIQAEGYNGSLSLHSLTAKYFTAPPFDRKTTVSLEEIDACGSLWEKIEGLYEQSQQQVDQSPLPIRIATLLDDIRWVRLNSNSHPMYSILSQELSSEWAHLYGFKQEDFRRIWKNQEPKGKLHSSHPPLEMWIASPKMVKDILKK